MVRQASNSDVFQALSCPTRRRLLRLLADRKRPVSDLVEELKIRQPSVSEQLRILRETGLVDVEKAGRTRIYMLNPEGFRPLVDWMTEFARFWDIKLDALSALLAKKLQEKPE